MNAFLAASFLYGCIFVNFIMASNSSIPVVVNTWPWPKATDAGWASLLSTSSSLDAVEHGCTQCEVDQCDGSVGFGNHPDENGETTLDAMIMNGSTMNVGSVGCLRSIKNAIGVARRVLENTEHTLLVGELATDFAVQMGFTKESLETNTSQNEYKEWKNSNCQPNYRVNVTPDPHMSCGPYSPTQYGRSNVLQFDRTSIINESNHDTIGMIAVNEKGEVAAGTSTNGLNHKIPGRVGDSPIVGAGAYADDDVGGAVATGDGDIMMRFLPAYQIVESMRRGLSPTEAAQDAISRMIKKYPRFSGAVIGVAINGSIGAACTGLPEFQFCIRNSGSTKTVIASVKCI